MATALVSAVSGRKIRRDVSMTGELTLTGRVLPIGGLKEKVLGAVRAGITEVILPIDNEADLEDIPDEVRERTTFHLAETLDDVISTALVGGTSTAKTILPTPTVKKKPARKKKASSASKASPTNVAGPARKAGSARTAGSTPN
jgi:ATP-dependent Lon protease